MVRPRTGSVESAGEEKKGRGKKPIGRHWAAEIPEQDGQRLPWPGHSIFEW